MIEYVDHLHEHFVDPVVISNGRYLAPTVPAPARRAPGVRPGAPLPDGPAWRDS